VNPNAAANGFRDELTLWTMPLTVRSPLKRLQVLPGQKELKSAERGVKASPTLLEVESFELAAVRLVTLARPAMTSPVARTSKATRAASLRACMFGT